MARRAASTLHAIVLCGEDVCTAPQAYMTELACLRASTQADARKSDGAEILYGPRSLNWVVGFVDVFIARREELVTNGHSIGVCEEMALFYESTLRSVGRVLVGLLDSGKPKPGKYTTP